MKIAIGISLLVALVLLLRAGELYTQLARYQRYWDRVNQKPIGKNDIVYIAFGDSAAQGIGASSPSKGYVGLIANELAKDTGKSVHVINLSKSGAKIKDVLDKQLPSYECMKISNKKVFTIEIGANDIITFNPGSFKSQMDELMGKLPTGTIISDIPSFKGGRHAGLESRVIRANQIISELADKHGLKLAGLYDNVKKNHGLRTFGGDFFHPSDYGYRTNWEPAFLPQVKSRENTL